MFASLVKRLKGSGTRQNMANYLFGGDDTQFAMGVSEEHNSQTVGIALDYGSVLVADRNTVASGQWRIGGTGLSITKGQASEAAGAFINYMISQDLEADPIWDQLGFIQPASPARQ